MSEASKGSGARNTEEMSKSELKKYHSEICEFYLQNGWRETLSKFLLSPTQGAEIIPDKIRDKRKELEKAQKRSEREERKAEKKAERKAKKEASSGGGEDQAPKKRGRKKKEASTPEMNETSAPKKRGRKKKEASDESGEDQAPKKRGRKKKEASTPESGDKPSIGRKKVKGPDSLDDVLDYLLRYRKKHGSVNLDEVIVSLTLQSRSM